MKSAWSKLAIVVAIGVVLALLPAPAGLAPTAWLYFAVFVAVVVGLILEPVPAAAIGLVGVTVAAVLGLPFTAKQLADPAFKPALQSMQELTKGSQ